MTNNRMKPKGKQVRSVKGQAAPSKTEVPLNHGNAPILTVKLLNAINENLIDIKKALKSGRS